MASKSRKRHTPITDTDSDESLTASQSLSKIVSEYDQEIPQTQTANNPVAPRGGAAQPSRDTGKTY